MAMAVINTGREQERDGEGHGGGRGGGVWGVGVGKLIRLADERRDSVNRQDWITFVTSADSWLPLPLCVSSNYTGTYRSGRQWGDAGGGGDESSSKTRTRTKPGKQKEEAKRLNAKP